MLEKGKRGRPPLGGRVQIGIQLQPQHIATLDNLANRVARGNRSAAMRWLLDHLDLVNLDKI